MKRDRSQPNSSPRADTAISFANACSIVTAQCKGILANRKLEIEDCNLIEAQGRVLAQPLLADRDQPPFARVTRDGFAVRADDLAAGVPLRVIGELRAGESWPSERPPLQTGETIEIMTGAPLPPGSDAVLMVEHAMEANGDATGSADFGRPAPYILAQPGRTLNVGENVVQRGKEARQGQVLLPAGTRLGPDAIGLAASCGRISLSVFSAPPVAILATGDELVQTPPSDSAGVAGTSAPESHQIYDSNSHSLAALVRQAHAIPLPQAAARDKKEDLRDRLQRAFALAPLVLVTGGVSMGRYDLVEDVLAGMGAEFFFTGVRMQPGKPVVFGCLPAAENQPARYFFGLPGNPVSTMVTFRVFVQPLLAALAGESCSQPRIALARLSTEVRVKTGLTRFLPAYLDTTHLQPAVNPEPTQGSGDLAANARANCYVIVPDDCPTIAADSTVQILMQQ